MLELYRSIRWVVRVCLAREDCCEDELGAHMWDLYKYLHCIHEEERKVIDVTSQRADKPCLPAGRQTSTRLLICRCSSAALWVLWQREDKKALEVLTRLLPNGRVDIYPGRLWAVAAAAPTEMIQLAVQNIEESILMDGEVYGEGPGDLWGLWVHSVISFTNTLHLTWLSLEPSSARVDGYLEQ